MSISVVNSATFEAEVLKSEEVVMVDFYADWCMPCKVMGKTLEGMKDKVSAKIVKLNVDESPDIARTYNVMSIPTMIVFKGGELKKTVVGAIPEESVIQMLSEI